MSHVNDDLELYALGALDEPDRARVSAHLAECPACREQARALEEVALALPATLPERDVPAGLRARILATARAEPRTPARAGRGTAWTSRLFPGRGTAWTSRLVPGRVAMATLALAVVALALVDLALLGQRDSLLSERDEYADLALRASHGGASWYMAGVDRWSGSGGTLYAPAKLDASAYAVFHDLKSLDGGTVYALWLIDSDGKWWRAANFMPNGDAAQMVVLDTAVAGYTECAVTVELRREGKRDGPVVMRSRI